MPKAPTLQRDMLVDIDGSGNPERHYMVRHHSQDSLPTRVAIRLNRAHVFN